MSHWPSAKARRVLAALLRIGWTINRQEGTSHRTLSCEGWADYVFAFHDQEEIGPRMMARIAKRTGLGEGAGTDVSYSPAIERLQLKSEKRCGTERNTDTGRCERAC